MDGDDAPPREEAAPRGWLARVRGHLMDLTPLKASRDFRLLFIGKSVSDFGDEIVAVVVPYQVYQLTRSPLAVGLIGLCQLLPVLVLPILGGAVADAVERRRMVLITHTFLALTSLAMAFNARRDEPLLWPLYVFAALSAGLYTFNRPAVSTWPARLLPAELLPSSNAMEAGFHTLAGMAGPVAAGVLLATIAPAGAFVFDAATFLVVIGAALMMRPSPPAHDAPPVSWEAVKDGFRFLRGKRNLQSVFLADLNAMIFGFPMALFPAVAERLRPGQPGVVGLLYAAPAVGAFLATAFSGRAKHVRRQGRAILIAVTVWGAAIVVFGVSTWLWLSLAMIAVAGAGDMVSGIYRASIMQTAVTDSMRGRLDGIGMAVWATGPSLGDLESGVVAGITGSVPFAVVSGGVLCILGVGVLRWFAPGFARYDARAPEP